ncbi:transmembrane 4 L6 family member 20 [Macrotis lagotis]|uniref:transmembrane 4 L6 family member 20 n=1 Tax=Macrotis lagotis TaxID=92651 RepID=UPI003D69E1E7
MTCCEGYTSCNGFSLMVLLLLAVVLNITPLAFYKFQQDEQNPISCYEWWYPGIIGAGVLVVPATVMSLTARKRGCCNNRLGMILTSFLSLVTIVGALYCVLVSVLALLEGPLICNYNGNSTVSCEFSLKNLTNYPDQMQESFNLEWMFNPTCQPGLSDNSSIDNSTDSFIPSTEENKHKTIHLTVFVGLLLVGLLEILFSISQIVIGLLGCLCGVSKQKSPQTW